MVATIAAKKAISTASSDLAAIAMMAVIATTMAVATLAALAAAVFLLVMLCKGASLAASL